MPETTIARRPDPSIADRQLRENLPNGEFTPEIFDEGNHRLNGRARTAAINLFAALPLSKGSILAFSGAAGKQGSVPEALAHSFPARASVPGM